MSIELFTCPRHPGGLRLTESSCAAQWQRGRLAAPWDSVYRCHGCAIGAANAGCPPPPPAPGRTLCCRCGRIGMRLIRGQICVSCYNREREVRIGKDRRGNVPVSLPSALSLSLAIGVGERFDGLAANRIELAIHAARKRPGLALARFPFAPPGIQAALVLGLPGRLPMRRPRAAIVAPEWRPVPLVRHGLSDSGQMPAGAVLARPVPVLRVPHYSLSFWGGI